MNRLGATTRAGKPGSRPDAGLGRGSGMTVPADEAYGYGPDGTWVYAPETVPRARRARATSGTARLAPPPGKATRRGRRRLIPLWVKWSRPGADRAGLPEGPGVRGGSHAVRGAAPDRAQPAPAGCEAELALAVGHGGVTTDTDIGPWVLQKIEGISRPALGSETFNFVFTHKVSKSIGFWPCWYSSTFAAVGRASATVDLNPGPGWWAPARALPAAST